MADKDIPSRLIDYIVAGATREQAASALGISLSYISDLFSSEEFTAALANKRAASLDKRIETEEVIREVESISISRIKNSLGMIMDPMKMLQVFKAVNAARVSQSTQPIPTSGGAIVSLTLPIQLTNNYVVDGSNKVISIGDQTLVTLQSQNLERLTQDHATTPQLPDKRHSIQQTIQPSIKSASDFDEFGLPKQSVGASR